MALSESAQVELTKRYQTRLAQIRAQAGAASATAWDGLDGYNEADVPTFARQIQPAVDAAHVATVETATGYYSALADVPPPAVDPSTVAPNINPRDPFISHWQALKAGHDWSDALASGRIRADTMAGDLVQSTSRRTGDAVYEATGTNVVGWRRVLTGGSCKWCATIASQRYKSATSADFGHDRCDCTAVPIYGDRDPGRVINVTTAAKILGSPGNTVQRVSGPT